MRPLYCYVVDMDTGELFNHIITNYNARVMCPATNRILYSYKLCGKDRTIMSTSLNKFVHGRLCTFTLTEPEARQIIRQTLHAKVNKARKDYNDTSELLGKFVNYEED